MPLMKTIYKYRARKTGVVWFEPAVAAPFEVGIEPAVVRAKRPDQLRCVHGRKAVGCPACAEVGALERMWLASPLPTVPVVSGETRVRPPSPTSRSDRNWVIGAGVVWVGVGIGAAARAWQAFTHGQYALGALCALLVAIVAFTCVEARKL